jgi:hypothetical protein
MRTTISSQLMTCAIRLELMTMRLIRRTLGIHSPSEEYLGRCWCQVKFKQTFINIIKRVGHRGAFLIFMGSLFILYGAGLKAAPGIGVPYIFVWNNNVWSWIFILAGTLTFSGAPLIDHDKWHYGLAATLSAVWSAAWVVTWMFHPLTHGAWALAAIWASDAAITVVVSFWPEYGREPKERLDPVVDEANNRTNE